MSRPIKGFKVLCPECGSPDGTVKIDLQDLKSCSCTECDWEGSPQEALKLLKTRAQQWAAVIRWVGLADAALAETEADETEDTRGLAF